MALNDRCILDRRVPITPSGDNNHVHILQSPGQVVILHEKIHDFRIIPVTRQPDVPDRIRQWLGASRGRWEGHTLVVETGNFRVQVDGLGSGLDRQVVERFTRRSDDVIEYSATVTDPSNWTAAVDDDGAVAGRRRATLRVRLSRGELQHDESPYRLPRGRCRTLTACGICATCPRGVPAAGGGRGSSAASSRRRPVQLMAVWTSNSERLSTPFPGRNAA